MINNQKLYYYFRTMASAEGELLVLYVFDRSTIPTINSNGAIFLTANGITVATTRPLSKLTYPKYACAGNIEPNCVIEVKFSDVKTELQDRDLWPKYGVIHFECIDSKGIILSEAAVFGYSVDTGNDLPLPIENNIKRVGGKISSVGFLVSGATWYQAINKLAKSELKKHCFSKSMRILDWGVGCGRIARYFIKDGYTGLSGVDIDQLNINWCQKYLPSAKFLRCDFDPPTQFSDSTFELIYAHSVFTHLAKDDEVAWLNELNRVLSPTGIACVTFTSEFGAYLAYNETLAQKPSFWAKFSEEGRIDIGALSVGVDEGRSGYYRTVFHETSYIMQEWSKQIDIVRIIYGFANNQDAVLFKKKIV